MFNRQEKFLLFILAAVNFSHIVDFMIMMPLGPALMRIFDINTSQFGLLVSAYTFTAGLSGFLASFFIDRFDRKKALQFFFFGFSIGTIACAFSPTYEILLTTRSLTGFFGGVLGSLVMSIVSDQIEYSRRGSAMGIIMSAFSLASILGVPFSLYLANQFDWHAPFLFLGVASVAVSAVIFLGLPPMHSHLHHLGHEKPSAFATLKSIANNRNQQLALLFMATMVFGHFAIIPFLSPSMVMNVGLTEAQLPLIYLVGGGFSIFTGPLIGRMADRFGKHRVYFVSGLVVLIPILLITHLGPSSIYWALSIVAFFFVASGGRMIPASAMVSSTVLPQQRGSFMSLVSSVQNLCSAAASYVAGMLVSKSSTGQLLNYERVGYFAVAFSLVAVYLSTKIKNIEQPLKIHPEDQTPQTQTVESVL
ncbi:MAG: MFS transporter [Bdellovibrionia bacterium]